MVHQPDDLPARQPTTRAHTPPRPRHCDSPLLPTPPHIPRQAIGAYAEERLQPGAWVVTLDKPLPSPNGKYVLEFVCQAHGSWGPAVAYVQRYK